MEECHKAGLIWNDDYVEFFEPLFISEKLTQSQVDAAIKAFIDIQRHQWNPQNYPLHQRLAIATHFLFGKLKPDARKN